MCCTPLLPLMCKLKMHITLSTAMQCITVHTAQMCAGNSTPRKNKQWALHRSVADTSTLHCSAHPFHLRCYIRLRQHYSQCSVFALWTLLNSNSAPLSVECPTIHIGRFKFLVWCNPLYSHLSLIHLANSSLCLTWDQERKKLGKWKIETRIAEVKLFIVAFVC